MTKQEIENGIAKLKDFEPPKPKYPIESKKRYAKLL